MEDDIPRSRRRFGAETALQKADHMWPAASDSDSEEDSGQPTLDPSDL